MKRNNAGSSLVEIVAATAIMGILVGAVCTSLMFGLRLNEKTDAKLQAQLAVSSAVEILMAEGITSEDTLADRFPEVTVTAERVTQTIDGAETPLPYFKVTVTGSVEGVAVTTHIREAVTDS